MNNYLQGNLYHNTAYFYDYDNRDIIKDDLEFYTEYANKTKAFETLFKYYSWRYVKF